MNIFTRLPYDVPETIGLVSPNEIIGYEQLIELTQAPESEAYEHWTFKDGLVGLVGQKQLIPVAGTVPSVANGVLTLSGISTATKKFMNSDLINPTQNGFTICIVAKTSLSLSGDVALAGYQTAQAGTASIFASANNAIKGNAINLGFGTAPTIAVPSTDWFFAAASYSNAALVVRNLAVASATTELSTNTFTGTGSIVNPSGADGITSVGIGASYANSGLADIDIEYAEFIIFNSSKTNDELAEIYQRSKIRMQVKNIDI